jgi:hypothetical protein
MSLTVSSKQWSNIGSRKMLTCSIAWDSSYAFGGESLDYTALGFTGIDAVHVQSNGGVNFEYDYTNKKLKAFSYAPPIIFEEPVTVTSNVGTLKYPAAYIMYVGVADASYKVIPGGLTPVTGSVSASEPIWGTRPTLTFLAGDSVTSCYVTYVTQAWKEVFDNYVLALLTAGARVSGHASLSFTSGTPDVISLGEYAVGIQSIMWNDNGTYKPMKALYKSETAATTEATIDYTDSGSSTTSLSVLESDTLDASTDSVYIAYIKDPGSGFLHERFIEEDDLTPSSDVITLSSGLAVGSNALLYGAAGDIAGPTTKYANIIRSGGSVSSTATLIQPTAVNSASNTFTLGSGHSDSDHLKPSYICGQAWEIPNLVQLEVPNGKSLSALSAVKVQIIGY